MRIYSSQPLQDLPEDDRKVVYHLLNEVLDASRREKRADAFFFEYKNITMMFAPEIDFLTEIPEMPLPSLGGDIAGHMILTAYSAANDRLPFPSEDSLL